MKLTDKQLERLKLRPDRVAAIRARRAEINRRRDERLYQTPITDRLLDVGPCEENTDETQSYRPRSIAALLSGHDGDVCENARRVAHLADPGRRDGWYRRIAYRFFVALVYAAAVALIVLAGNEFFKWVARGGHRVLIDRITQEARP